MYKHSGVGTQKSGAGAATRRQAPRQPGTEGHVAAARRAAGSACSRSTGALTKHLLRTPGPRGERVVSICSRKNPVYILTLHYTTVEFENKNPQGNRTVASSQERMYQFYCLCPM